MAIEKRTRLCEAQRRALAALVRRGKLVGYTTDVLKWTLGIRPGTVGVLADRGYLAYDGHGWNLTDAGRAALAESSESDGEAGGDA